MRAGLIGGEAGQKKKISPHIDRRGYFDKPELVVGIIFEGFQQK